MSGTVYISIKPEPKKVLVDVAGELIDAKEKGWFRSVDVVEVPSGYLLCRKVDYKNYNNSYYVLKKTDIPEDYCLWHDTIWYNASIFKKKVVVMTPYDRYYIVITRFDERDDKVIVDINEIFRARKHVAFPPSVYFDIAEYMVKRIESILNGDREPRSIVWKESEEIDPYELRKLAIALVNLMIDVAEYRAIWTNPKALWVSEDRCGIPIISMGVIRRLEKEVELRGPGRGHHAYAKLFKELADFARIAIPLMRELCKIIVNGWEVIFT